MPRQQDSLRINNLAPMDSQIEITLTVAAATGTAGFDCAISASFEVEVLGVAGFSAAPLYLGSDPQAPPGLLFGMVPGTGSGPLSVTNPVGNLTVNNGGGGTAIVNGFRVGQF